MPRGLRQKTRKRSRKQHNVYPGPSQCHPRISDAKNGCFPPEILKEFADALDIPGSVSHKEIKEKLGKELGEYSLLKKIPISQERRTEIAKKYLRPSKPHAWIADPDMWLDSNNIANVMKQYEESNPEFEFMGPFPIDFAAPDPYNKDSKKCLITEICNFRVQTSLAAGKKYIGIVYNLDPHFKSGSHWVANYIDIPRKMCYYFDSYGMKPPHQIAKFMRWITTHDPEIQLRSNGRRFQFQNTECGMYCLYFLIRMLSGDDFKTLVRRDPPDAFMLSLRDWLFST